MSKTSGGQACTSKVHNNGEQRATEAAKKISFDFQKRKQNLNSNFANSHKLIGFYFPPDISSSKFLRDRGPITGPKQDILDKISKFRTRTPQPSVPSENLASQKKIESFYLFHF